MTREEASEILSDKEITCLIGKFHGAKEALDVALSALRPVSREQVEKMFPGCPKCKYEDGKEPMNIYYPDGWDNGIGFEYGNAIFCPECGRPLTDEAVQMVMERLEALKDADN